MKARGILIGLALALIAFILALGMSGGGHGWNTPMWASFALWILLPLTFGIIPLRGGVRGDARSLAITLLLVGFVADAALWWATIREGTEYFWMALEKVAPFTLLWLAIWGSWQLVAILALVRRADVRGEAV